MKIKHSLLIIISLCIGSCSDDGNNSDKFSQEELSPVVTFTYNNKPVRISAMNGPMFTSGSALNEKGEQIEGIKTKGFASVIDSIGNGRYQFTLLISKWISEEDIEYTTSNGYIEVIKSETFQNIFTRGERLYAKNANPINTTDEVLIEYTDENGVYWGSSYQGNFYSTPSYSSLQPSASFNITRRMPFGNDSVFVEAKFKVRLYKNTSEYFEINDGYFRGFYYRKF